MQRADFSAERTVGSAKLKTKSDERKESYMMCIAAMRNMTAAIKGRNALEAAGIRCTIVSLEHTLTKRGCAYGLSFACAYLEKAKSVLSSRRINYGEILGGS